MNGKIMNMKDTLVAVFMALLTVGAAQAVDYTWNGAASGAWNTPANWSPNGLPGAGDTVYFPSAVEITDGFTIGAGTLTITNGTGTVSLKGNITGSGRMEKYGVGALALYGNNTFSGGFYVQGARKRSDGTTISTSNAGDSSPIHLYSGSGLGAGVAQIDNDVGNGGLSLGNGSRLYVHGPSRLYMHDPLTVTTPILLGGSMDDNPILEISGDVTFSEDVKSLTRFKVRGDGGIVHFNKAFGEKGYYYGYPGSDGHFHYHGVVAVNYWYCDRNEGKHHLYSTGNLLLNVLWGSGVVFEADDALHGNAMYNAFNLVSWKATASVDLNGHRERMTGLTAVPSDESPSSRDYGYINTSEAPGTMMFYLHGGGYKTFSFNGYMRGNMNFIWDATNDANTSAPGTLTIGGADKTMTGSLIVSNGIVRLAEGISFTGLSMLRVVNSARLEMAQAPTNPFVADTVELSTNARLSLPAGARLSVSHLWVPNAVTGDMEELPKGIAYSSANLSQIEGDGTIVVTSREETAWRTATNGSWGEAANWTDGVPGMRLHALLTAKGDSYAVTVNAATVATNMTVANAGSDKVTLNVASPLTVQNACLTLGQGANVVVPVGSRFVSDTANFGVSPGNDTVTISDGARVSVDGELSVTNLRGRIWVGMSGTEGRVDVKGDGVFAVTPEIVDGTFGGSMILGSRGVICVSDRGVFGRYAKAGAPAVGAWFIQSGGMMLFSNNSQCVIGPTWASYFGPGTTRFTGNSSLKVKGTFDTYLNSNDTEKPLVLEFEDNSKIDMTEGSFSTVNVNPERRCTTRLRFANNSDVYLGYVEMGKSYKGGTAELVQSAGHLWFNDLKVSAGASDSADAYPYSTVKVRVEGGCLVVNGQGGSVPQYKNQFNGLLIGEGHPSVGAPLANGRFELVDGTVTNGLHHLYYNAQQSMFLMGAGRGRGEFVQTGGSFVSLATQPFSPMMVGIQSGQGLYAISNGTAQIGGDVWIGGCPTNVMQRTFVTSRGDLVTAEGSFVAAAADASKACSFTAGGTMTVGAQGTGRVEIGGGATVSLGGLVLSNQTASVLAFTGGANGFGTISVAGAVTVADGALLVVDGTLVPPAQKKRKLLTCSEMRGRFAEANITLIDPEGRFKIVQKSTGIECRRNSGMMLLVR